MTPEGGEHGQNRKEGTGRQTQKRTGPRRTRWEAAQESKIWSQVNPRQGKQEWKLNGKKNKLVGIKGGGQKMQKPRKARAESAGGGQIVAKTGPFRGNTSGPQSQILGKERRLHSTQQTEGRQQWSQKALRLQLKQKTQSKSAPRKARKRGTGHPGGGGNEALRRV